MLILFTVLICLLFLLLFPSFSTISVLLLCVRLESLFPSSLLFLLLLIVLVLFVFP